MVPIHERQTHGIEAADLESSRVIISYFSISPSPFVFLFLAGELDRVCVMVLQTFGKRPQALVEGRRIVPESCVSRVRHHLNLSVSQASDVLSRSGL
jgi:hypothetical protein